MDKNKAIDLIKAKTLGCLTKEEDAEFREYMESGEDFPWDVLGEYQNLTALLPMLLQLEVPASDLKDNVARKLYKILEELKAKQQAEITPVQENETSEPEPEIVTETEVKKSLPEEPVKFSVGGESSAGDQDFSTVSTDDIQDLEITEQEVEEKSSKGKVEGVADEKLERQKTLEYIKSYYKEDMDALKGASKKNRLITIILFSVLLVLLAVIYFLLSSGISSNNDEIEKLKMSFDDSHTLLQDDNLS